MPEDTIYDYNNTSNSRPELSAKPVDKRPMIIGGAVALGIIIIAVVIGWLLFRNPETAAVLRDIFIIFLGLGVFIVILLISSLMNLKSSGVI